MTTPRIQSHHEPRRFLKQHVAEIVAALDAILEGHRDAPWRSPAVAIAREAAWSHDLGKGTPAFQSYIAAPTRWRGDPRQKSHAMISSVLALRAAEVEGWEDSHALATAFAVRGHHGGIPSSAERFVDPFTDDQWRPVLDAQLAALDLDALAAELSRALPPSLREGGVRRARRYADALFARWRALGLDEKVHGRFVARAAWSMLLEADKAFLAVERAQIRAWLHRARPSLPPARIDALYEGLTVSPMSTLREQARAEAAEGFARHTDDGVLSLTLPTGAGKTLIAARWALAERCAVGDGSVDAPMVVVALPMLSIVDQTERVWRAALSASADDGETLIASHSLSERTYDSDLDQGTAEFFLDTWRSDVVITTFDQLLLALYDDRARHGMRYHRLLDARIVIDEVQCIPAALWAPVSAALKALTTEGRTKVLVMSATQPRFLDAAAEVLDAPQAFYASLSRYEFSLDIDEVLGLDAFIARATQDCLAHMARGEGTLVTVNVRATAQVVWEALDTALRAEGLAGPLLLSGDMTPGHRLHVIDEIKRDPVRVVVSTQCVEAGVDIDMHHVLRDFAPLDALVQIAGRCNRNARRETPGTVTVVSLRRPGRSLDAAMIYDPILLDCTRAVLRGVARAPEREVFALCQRYFDEVRARKSDGEAALRRWADLDAPLDVRGLLRGGDDDREGLLVTEQDPTLLGAITEAMSIEDRWERRSAMRGLAPRLARVTVAVSEKTRAGLKVQDRFGFPVLAPGQYHPDRGIVSV